MKIIITTTYDNVDQDWFEWWVRTLDIRNAEGPSIAEELRTKGKSFFENKDPSSPVTGKTEYQVVRDADDKA